MSGDWVLNTSASIAVFDRTGSTTAVSLLLGLALVPTLLIAPLAGALADRQDRRLLMVTADVLGAIVVLLAALAALAGLDLASVYVAVFLLAALAAFRRPAAEAIRPSIAGESRLNRANSMIQTATRLGMIGGPAAAAALMGTGGLELALTVDAVSFAASAVLVRGIARVKSEGGGDRVSRFRSAIDGLRFAHTHPGVRTTVTAIGIVMLAAPVVNAGTLALVKDEIGAPESRYGILLAVEGVGALALAILFAWLGAHLRVLAGGMAGLAMTGIATIVVGSAPNLAIAAAGMALMGSGVVAFQISFTGYLQREAPDQYRGRVMSLAAMTAAFAGLLGFAVAGPLVDLVGVRQAFVGAGILILLTVVPVSTLALRGGGATLPPDAALSDREGA